MNIADYWQRDTNKDAVQSEIRAVKIQDSNPCILWWGAGPDGATCGQCAHRRGVKMAKTYWKCDLRPDLTHGAKTDQKASFLACAKFEPLQLDPRAQALQQRKETR